MTFLDAENYPTPVRRKVLRPVFNLFAVLGPTLWATLD